MKHQHFVAVLVLCLLCCVWGWAEVPDSSAKAVFEKGLQLEKASQTSEAAACFELAMEMGAGSDPALFGAAQGKYWELIARSNDFPRAYSFFCRLVQAGPASADVLAAQAGAIGGYLGWLKMNGWMEVVGGEKVRKLDTEARSLYEQALAKDPASFQALFSYAVYESHSPNGGAHARELFQRLNGLRGSHPEYPWAMVDQMAGACPKN